MPGRQVDRFGRRIERRLEPRGLSRRFVAQARDHHEKLVAAPAKHVVGLADVTLQEARDVTQDAVTGLVAERVVDRLESIDVDEEQRERLA